MSEKRISWKRRLRNRIRDRLFKHARKMSLRRIICWKLWQWISGSNRGVWWPVHPSSTVVHPERITMSEGNRPGYSAACYIQATNGIVIGDRVLFAPGCSVISANHDPQDVSKHLPCRPVRIGNRCWIGAGAAILPGVELGDGVVVGAGAVVTKSFPARVVVAGVPATVIRHLDGEEEEAS